MCKKDGPFNQVKICKGPGCRAWESEKLLSLLLESCEGSAPETRIQASSAPCLRRCGGGISVEILPHKRVLKFRGPQAMLQALNVSRQLSPA